MELNSTKDLLCIVSPEKARNYKWRMPDNVDLQAIEIAPLKEVLEKYSFTDCAGISIEPKEKETYIRDPFEKWKFYENSFESARQLENERSAHFKEIAHLLGLKKFELQREKSKRETTETKSNADPLIKVNVDLKQMNLDAESFFCMTEFDPIPDMTRERYGEVCYRQAMEYARKYNLCDTIEVKALLNARKPGTGMLKRLIQKYEYLSNFTKALDLSINLEPMKSILKISPVEKLIPNGFDLKRTREVVERQMVSFEMEFYNYET